MNAQVQAAASPEAPAPLSVFERWLTLWVALCIVTGIALGSGCPASFAPSARWKWRA